MDDYYDATAEGYDELYGSEQEQKMEVIRQHIQVDAHSTLLDIGCGSGISTNFDCSCVGIDPSEKLIELARKKFSEQTHTFHVAPAEDLSTFSFGEKEFDYVLCVSAIHHVAEQALDDVLIEIKRIGKKFVCTILNRIPQKQSIINSIEKYFTITTIIEEEKDTILFCE